ncbi:MAG: nucleotide pyrophosphatase, partial [Peptococcaceae bacterium]|nr:nucleotide pyrophosphatase [Peptococcaceae bacterium]
CLLLKNEEGVYDRVAVYMSKEMPQAVAVLVKGEYVRNVPGVVPKGRTGEMERVIRNMRLLDCAEDGTYIRMWASQGFSAEDNCVWYPHWVFDKVVGKFGPPVPTGQGFGGDFDIMDTNFLQWEQAAEYQANGIKYMMQEEGVEVVFSHFHGPDMMGHCYLTWLKERKTAVDPRSISPAPEAEILKLHERTYQITDDYIGEFLPLIDEGWTILLFSDHSLVVRNEDNIHGIGDNMGVNVEVMQKLGYTVLQKDENGNDIPEIDWEKTRAIQQRSNSIFINLKGRDRFGIVDPADKYELEEQIITDLYGYKDSITGKRVISMALHKKDANLLGLGGEYTAGDIIFFVHDDYAVDHGEGLSTATGYNDTTLSPIFVAAGPGIKEGYEMELFPREVDVAPTAAVLLGVRIPAQCEGCPSYSILSEEL